MRLYISNCTHQEQVRFYNLPETTGYRQMRIPALGQVLVGNLNQPQVDAIIHQLERYGLTALKDVERAKAKVPNVFDIDKPVPAKVIQRVYDHNTQVSRFEGAERRKLAAVADSNVIDSAVTRAAQDARIGDPGRFTSRRFETTVEQVDAGSFTEDAPLEEGVRIAKSGDAPRGGSRRRAA